MKLHALVGTESEFDHAEKGDALYAFELALCVRGHRLISLVSLLQNMLVARHARWDSMAISTYLATVLKLCRAVLSSSCELLSRGASHAVPPRVTRVTQNS